MHRGGTWCDFFLERKAENPHSYPKVSVYQSEKLGAGTLIPPSSDTVKAWLASGVVWALGDLCVFCESGLRPRLHTS